MHNGSRLGSAAFVSLRIFPLREHLAQKWPNVITYAQRQIVLDEKSSENALRMHSTVFIAVAKEVAHGFLLLSSTKEALVFGSRQMQLYVTLAAVGHAHAACASRAK